MKGDRIRRCIEKAMDAGGHRPQISLQDLSHTPNGSWVAYFEIRGSRRVLHREALVLTFKRWASERDIAECVLERINEALPLWISDMERRK
jgi:hypothetical protein